MRLSRRVSACAGDSQTPWAEATFVVAVFVVAGFVVAGFVGAGFVGAILRVDDASTTESPSCLVESAFAWRFAGAGFMRNMTLPFS